MPSPPGHVAKELIAEARRAINDGNEDCIGLERIRPLMCEAVTPPRLYGGDSICPYKAVFLTRDGKRYCQLHAELWAATHNEEAEEAQ